MRRFSAASRRSGRARTAFSKEATASSCRPESRNRTPRLLWAAAAVSAGHVRRLNPAWYDSIASAVRPASDSTKAPLR
eukprot:scaffold10399_cov94-Isochrysis_galbana.AAC.11